MRLINPIISICLLPLITACQSSSPKTIAPFTTDGCSDFPEGTPSHKDLWHKCCTAHDVKYWAGGSYDERLQADLELRACVQSVGEPAVAEIMLAGVRVGGENASQRVACYSRTAFGNPRRGDDCSVSRSSTG